MEWFFVRKSCQTINFRIHEKCHIPTYDATGATFSCLSIIPVGLSKLGKPRAKQFGKSKLRDDFFFNLSESKSGWWIYFFRVEGLLFWVWYMKSHHCLPLSIRHDDVRSCAQCSCWGGSPEAIRCACLVWPQCSKSKGSLNQIEAIFGCLELKYHCTAVIVDWGGGHLAN